VERNTGQYKARKGHERRMTGDEQLSCSLSKSATESPTFLLSWHAYIGVSQNTSINHDIVNLQKWIGRELADERLGLVSL